MIGRNIESHTIELDPNKEKKGGLTVYLDLMRHANRLAGKGEWTDPETGEVITFDDTENLTPKGIDNAKLYGANLPDVDVVVGVGSMEDRAQETAGYVEEGAGKKRKLPPSKVSGITYKELGPDSQAGIKKFRPLIQEAAAKFPDYGKISPELRAKAREKAQAIGLREAMKDEKFTHELACAIAYNVLALHEMAKGAYNSGLKDSKVAMPLVNHSMFNESFLIEVLDVTDEASGEKTRLNNINDLGNFFQPGESFRIQSTISNGSENLSYSFTSAERQKLFAGKKLSINWDKVKNLAMEHEAKIRPGQKSIIE